MSARIDRIARVITELSTPTLIGPKVSMHAMCLTSLGMFAAFLYSPWWLLALAAALPIVIWSRLQLGHHSKIEVVLGTGIAVVLTTVAWLMAPV